MKDKDIKGQLQDFIRNCPSDSHMYKRIYNTHELLRTLKIPCWRDVIGQVERGIEGLLVGVGRKNNQQNIDLLNVPEVEEKLQQALLDQVMEHTGIQDPKMIAPLDMQKIREEYLARLRYNAKEDAELQRYIKKTNSSSERIDPSYSSVMGV